MRSKTVICYAIKEVKIPGPTDKMTLDFQVQIWVYTRVYTQAFNK